MVDEYNHEFSFRLLIPMYVMYIFPNLLLRNVCVFFTSLRFVSMLCCCDFFYSSRTYT